MNWEQIKKRIKQKKKGEVPEQGYLLAYTMEQVIFRKYNSLEELDIIFKNIKTINSEKNNGTIWKDILEIHFFNKEKEYRILASKSKRKILTADLCAIEHIAEFKNAEVKTVSDSGEEKIEGVYREKIQLEPAFIKPEYGIKKDYIIVLNHISYEHGLAKIDDYRLIMEG